MYKVKVSEDEKERISTGNIHILLTKLEEVDKVLTRELKKHRGDDTAYLQGISSIVDELIVILKRNA